MAEKLSLPVRRSSRSKRTDPLPRVAERIVLRRLRPSDLAEFQAYRADPEIGRYQGWSPLPAEMAETFLREMTAAEFGVVGPWFQLAIAERSTDRLIGDIGFCICGPDNQHAELGFSLARHAQGRGLATEAVRTVIDLLFERTAIARVVAMTDARNQACIRLLQRADLRPIGTVNTVLRGEPCVEYIYAAAR